MFGSELIDKLKPREAQFPNTAFFLGGASREILKT